MDPQRAERLWTTSQQLLAYELVHAAYFDDNPETSFILLVTAIEALLLPPEEAPRDIAEVIAQLQQSLYRWRPTPRR
jgi:hypothetical protein